MKASYAGLRRRVLVEAAGVLLEAVPAAAGMRRRVRNRALPRPREVLGEAARPLPEVVEHEDAVEAAPLQLLGKAQHARDARRIVLPHRRLDRRDDPKRLRVRPFGRRRRPDHVDAGGLQPVQVAAHLVPAGLVALARQRRSRPVVEAADEQRLAVLDEARAAHLEPTGQLLARRRQRRGRRVPRRARTTAAEARRSQPRRPEEGLVSGLVRACGLCRMAQMCRSSACARPPSAARLAAMKRFLLLVSAAIVLATSFAARADGMAPLGITWAGWKGDYRGVRQEARDVQGRRLPDRVVRPQLRLRRPRQDRSRRGPRRDRAGRRRRGGAARRLHRRAEAAPGSARVPAGLRPLQVGQPQLARGVPVARLLRRRPDERRVPRRRRVRRAAHAQDGVRRRRRRRRRRSASRSAPS